MPSTKRIVAFSVAGLLVIAGGALLFAPRDDPQAAHTMPDGTTMAGAEHPDDQHDAVEEGGPSAAAAMVCGGQVETAVASVTRLDERVSPDAVWEAPMLTCTFDIDGAPLVITVHDATDVETGRTHFDQARTDLGAEPIEGLLGLGLPSFSTGEGVVGFLRDGKTLTVDATALPAEVGGDRTLHGVAYAIASAVLTCWVEHD